MEGSFVSTFDGDRLDASLLLMGELQFVEPDDPRFIGTLRAVEKHLQRGDFLLRYDEEDDFDKEILKDLFEWDYQLKPNSIAASIYVSWEKEIIREAIN